MKRIFKNLKRSSVANSSCGICNKLADTTIRTPFSDHVVVKLALKGLMLKDVRYLTYEIAIKTHILTLHCH